jgi:hypothetical protein
MLTKQDLLKIFREKCGENIAHTNQELYDIYTYIKDNPLVHYSAVIDLIEQRGIESTHIAIRHFYANRGIEMTPREVEEWLNIVIICREEQS